jgi:hypothetical protein
MQFEADDRGRHVVVLGELLLVFIDRINGEDVVVGLIALILSTAVACAAAKSSARLTF